MLTLVCLCVWPQSPLLKFSIYKLWPCAYCWCSTGHMSKPVCLCAWPQARFWNPVYKNCGPVLTVEAPQVICQNWCACVYDPRARFWNPLYINCGPVLTVEEPTGHMLKLVCLCVWPQILLLKLHIYKLWPCAYCWSPTGHMPKPLCLCVWPQCRLLKSSIYKLWHCAYCGSQNCCACVPAHVPNSETLFLVSAPSPKSSISKLCHCA